MYNSKNNRFLNTVKRLPVWLREIIGYSLIFLPWVLSLGLGNDHIAIKVLALLASGAGLIWLLWLAHKE